MFIIIMFKRLTISFFYLFIYLNISQITETDGFLLGFHEITKTDSNILKV
jgi:hypothetical protein